MDNSITVVEPPVETYSDNNLNEKNLGTQYIYTTEGELIPAGGNHNTSNMDLNSQNSNTYMIDEPSYIPQASEVPSTQQQQIYTSEATTEQPAATSEYSATSEIEHVYTAEQPVVSDTQVSSGPVISENLKEHITQVADNQNVVVKGIDSNEEISGSTSENLVESGDSIVVGKQNSEDNISVPDESPNNVQSVEIEEVPDFSSGGKVMTSGEDESSLENLTSGPSIETQNTESIGATEESSHDSEIDHDIEIPAAKVENLTHGAVKTEGIIQNQEANDTAECDSQEDIPSEESATHVVAESEEGQTEARTEVNVPVPKPRGRKPKTDIPLHILGHELNKPVDNIMNGKTPKPRLGVKVPYRNLTSQIVSKSEIEKEIIERGRKKQEEKKEISFARQLTSRLAQKIAPESDINSKTKVSKSPDKRNNENTSQDNPIDVDSNGNQENSQDKPKDTIDNTDLLAILEGDGDAEELGPVLSEPSNKESTPTDETNLKNLEREIALQQLQDLPYLSPKTKLIKGNRIKVYSKEKRNEKPEETQKPASGKGQVIKSPIKSNTSKLEVEPQIKVNMTLKTYSRKRKSTDVAVESSPSPSKKTNVIALSTEEIDIKPTMQPPSPGPVYVTKSSRVIKKKVIWDPDETPSKLKPSLAKTEASIHPNATPPKNDNKSADSVKKSADLIKKSADSVKKSAAIVKVKIEKKVEEKSPKKTSSAEKRSSPGTQKQAVKHKKPRSELDRLLGDEGAIKMLYEVKNSENSQEEKRNKTVISVEKTFKELAKKADQIKSDLVNTSASETPKFLRKKEPAVSPVSALKPLGPPTTLASVIPGGISRQKSKDSARSTPPPSPAFNFPNEVSYLIRRRSSSSISSGDETGESLDFDDTEERTNKKKPISTPSDPLKIRKPKKNSESEKLQKRAENRIGHYKSFNVKKTNKSVTIDLHTGNSTGCYFTAELLNELTTVLKKISKEEDCNVVLVKSSKETVFSYGLNYKQLIFEKENTRETKANDLAERVRKFIQCLMDFPKILVAGIQGECVGLAVTMLPLFDIVIASDDAKFSTPYSTLGCVAEAGFLLTMPHMSTHGMTGELLYASQQLTADEACRRGLISKLCWPEKYQDIINSTLTAVSQGSRQSLEATKQQLRSIIKESFAETIECMTSELVDHWTSDECQSNFAKIV